LPPLIRAIKEYQAMAPSYPHLSRGTLQLGPVVDLRHLGALHRCYIQLHPQKPIPDASLKHGRISMKRQKRPPSFVWSTKSLRNNHPFAPEANEIIAKPMLPKSPFKPAWHFAKRLNLGDAVCPRPSDKSALQPLAYRSRCQS